MTLTLCREWHPSQRLPTLRLAGLVSLAYNSAPSRGLSMSQLFQAGLNITAIGMGVVFVLLTLLVFIIQGMSALSRMIEGPEPAPETQGSSQSLPQQELVSVISAAIAAYRKRH
jgi:sodium pump decarboxylase gamma subunit